MNAMTRKSPADFGTVPCFKFETTNPERMYWILQKKFKLERLVQNPDGYKFSVPYGKALMHFDVTWDGIVWNLDLKRKNGISLNRWVEEGERDWLVLRLNKISNVIHSLEQRASSSSSRPKSE